MTCMPNKPLDSLGHPVATQVVRPKSAAFVDLGSFGARFLARAAQTQGRRTSNPAAYARGSVAPALAGG